MNIEAIKKSFSLVSVTFARDDSRQIVAFKVKTPSGVVTDEYLPVGQEESGYDKLDKIIRDYGLECRVHGLIWLLTPDHVWNCPYAYADGTENQNDAHARYVARERNATAHWEWLGYTTRYGHWRVIKITD